MYMKKIILALLILLPALAFTQTNGTNNNPYTNPYERNPYSNPENNQKDPNFFNKNKNTNSDQDQSLDKSKTDQIDKVKEEKLKKINQSDFQDLNNSNQVQELYMNDPDYLKYVNSSNASIYLDSSRNGDELTSVDTIKKVYGANFFGNNVFDLSDRTLGAPPLDYRLGPGDEVIVSLWGNAELQPQAYTISKDGSIFPRLIGKIYLQGLTFESAQKVVESKFKKIVPSNTTIDVQMGKTRTIRVTLVGEVRKQGTYTISAFNTALNALSRAGGITAVGNLRRIEIKRDGRTIDNLDLYKYLQKGTQAEEIYLEDNDYIYVDVYDKIVEARGLFKRPMFYQLTENEGLRDLVEFAGGATSNARNSLIHIKTISNEQEVYMDIPGKDFFNSYSYDDVLLRDGDMVDLKPINEGLQNIVKVEGAVEYPDEYEVKDGDRISDVLRRAGGVSKTAYKPRAYVFRGNNSESESMKIDLGNLAEPNNNIQLFPGDRIKILSSEEFGQKYFIEVFGYVRKPQKVPYYKNMKLKDVLLLCGGLRLDAENGRIEISNIVDSVNKYEINSKGQSVKVVSINANLEIDNVSENIVIKPMDKIFVRQKSEFLTQGMIKILGEVEYPGQFVLVNQNERISSIILRSGGLKKGSYAEGARLYRANVGQVVIDLHKALSVKGSKQDIILKDSDVIIIPSLSDIVSVKGEVQSPVNMKFDPDNSNLIYYVSQAGGYGERPWKNRINVKYQNGSLKSTKNFVFFRVYPKVKAGSTVNIPTKPKRENKTSFSEIFTYSLSAITTLATLVVLSRSLK